MLLWPRLKQKKRRVKALKKYKVKLKFIYSDIVHVEAENEKQAIEIAFGDCCEQYENFYDAEVAEE